MKNLRSNLCPKCQRKGLHYAEGDVMTVAVHGTCLVSGNHPNVFGWKDYFNVECRFCHARFTMKEQV